jgi:hypothetical protein
MIVYLPQFRGGQFIDPTSRYDHPLRRSPYGLAGRQALVLEDMGHRFQGVPEAGDTGLRLDIRRDIAVTAEGDLTIQERLEFHDDWAAVTRATFASLDPSDRRAIVQQRLSGDKPARLEELKIEGLDVPETPLVLEVKYRVERGLQTFDGQLLGAAPLSWERDVLQPAFVEHRHSPFALRTPLRISAQVTVSGAEGFAPPAPLKAQELENEFVRLSIAPVAAEKQVAWRIELARPTGQHPADRYAAYVDAMTQARRACQPQLVLRPASK